MAPRISARYGWTYAAVDHISLHMYFANRTGYTQNDLSLNHTIDRYITTVESTLNLVNANTAPSMMWRSALMYGTSGITRTRRTAQFWPGRKADRVSVPIGPDMIQPHDTQTPDIQTPRHYHSFTQAFAVADAEELSGESYFAALSAAEGAPNPGAALDNFLAQLPGWAP